MDQQHPIPQQISSYQFRLVGNMTLKQFFQIGGGALVSLIIYSTNLHPIIKWPLIILSFAFGAALAFLPFEERPLSRWILAFFKSVYSPTAYFWEKSKKAPIFFREEAPTPKESGFAAPHGEMVMEDYLKTLPQENLAVFSKLEDAEKGFLARMANILSSGVGALKQATQKTATPIREEDLKKPDEKKEEKPKELTVPSNKPVRIAEKGFRPKIVIEEKPVEKAPKEKFKTAKVGPALGEETITGQAAQFSVDAAPPNPPTIPNTIVGQVMDPQGKIIEGAILEIRDIAGRPVRALRSNKLGHFMIVTSLQNGQYDIVTEKEGYVFQPVTFEAKGQLIPPIAIRAIKKVEPSLENEQKANVPSLSS
jgi:hypothetical protein